MLSGTIVVGIDVVDVVVDDVVEEVVLIVDDIEDDEEDVELEEVDDVEEEVEDVEDVEVELMVDVVGATGTAYATALPDVLCSAADLADIPHAGSLHM